MKKSLMFLWVFLGFGVGSFLGAQEGEAQEELSEYDKKIMALDWIDEGEGKIGSLATLKLPAGGEYIFVEERDAQEFLVINGNPRSRDILGAVGPAHLDWFVVFSWEETGYVKDDEKDDLDPDELLQMMRDGEEEVNEQRRQNGMSGLVTKGWAMEPAYNEETNQLEWAVILVNDNGVENVNHRSKILGREGVMNAILVCAPEMLDQYLPVSRALLQDFVFVEGKKYADFQEGDKVAKYGLMGLVAGGSLFAAAKLGILAKIGLFFAKFKKAAIAAVVAVGVGIKVLFGKIFGRKEEDC